VLDEPKPAFPRQHQEKPGLESELEPRLHYQASRYRAAGKLEGKAALVTGSDSGIGRAVTVLFAREGADVSIVYLPAEQSDGEETRKAVEAEGRKCRLLPGDCREASFNRREVEETVQKLGRFDILANNAAHQDRKEIPEQISDEEWNRTFQTNIYAYFRLVKAALSHLKPGASIIATSSITGLQGSAQLLDYSATKGAIDAFTKALAQNLISRGIRVNAVAPGPVWTPLNAADRGMKPEKVAEFGNQTLLQRPTQSEEIAPVYVFLASDADSSFITGEVISELGGKMTAA
jgi:NAD(P)-dependent dehydrogenase (short-subunit alcohol dehydrogenase family)